MTVLIKLLYAAMLAALLIVTVAFGARTLYEPPEPPDFRVYFSPGVQPPSQEEQDEYQRAYEAYEEKLADYHRNVFLVAAVFAIAFVAGGLLVPAKLDAIRLGLVAGGFGTFLYGVIQAGGDLDESAPVIVFVIAVLGLVLLGYSGYRWLGRQESQT